MTKNEFKKLTKTVKCKFQDIGGKGNVVQLAHNVLSTDMDNFVKHIQCGSLGLLWKNKGRPRRKDVRRICKKEFCGYSYKNGDPEKQLDEETERCNNLNEKLRLAHEEENKKKTSEMFGNYMIDKIGDSKQELLVCVCLDTKNQVLSEKVNNFVCYIFF